MKIQNNLKAVTKIVLASITVSSLFACVTSTEKLNIEGNRVRITSSVPGKNCTFIRQVSVTSKAAPGFGQNPTEELHNKLRNRAADLRGNLVYVESLGLNGVSGGGAVGSVYECR